MTALSSYSTGTVAVAADGTTVTGTSTLWLSAGNAKPGDFLQVGHFGAFVVDVADDTHLTIPPWPGATVSGAAYNIWKLPRFWTEIEKDIDRIVSALNTTGLFVFVGAGLTEPDPSLGEEDQFAFQPATGKMWVKSGGIWDFLGIYKGFNFTGAYSGATVYSVGDVMTDAGSSYVWINPTPGSGHPAPNTTYWQLLASKGDPGNTGPTGAGYGGTSTTSRAIGTGSKAFTTQAGLAYTNGARVRASSAANTANWMEGVATYASTTLTINVDKTGGSGTLADWNFNLAGEPGTGDVTAANNGAEFNAAAFATTLSLVRYAAQSLTAAQKAQARANLDVLKKNYLLNSAFMVSQENPLTAVTTTGAYPVDQFQVAAAAVSTAAFSAQQIAATSPAGSPNRLRVTVTAAQASVGASIVYIGQPIEGNRIADLLWGTAGAKTVTCQFGVKAPVAGTYLVQMVNSAQDTSPQAFITIAPGEVNTDVVKTVTLAGATTGTWLTNNGLGATLRVILMLAAQTANVFATNGNVFELFDVGIYEGSSAPAFQVPDFDDELRKCQRYFFQTLASEFFAIGSIRSGATSAYFPSMPCPVPMRDNPIITRGTSAAAFIGDNQQALTGLTATATPRATLNLNPTWAGAIAGASIGSAVSLYSGTTPTKFNARL